MSFGKLVRIGWRELQSDGGVKCEGGVCGCLVDVLREADKFSDPKAREYVRSIHGVR